MKSSEYVCVACNKREFVVRGEVLSLQYRIYPTRLSTYTFPSSRYILLLPQLLLNFPYIRSIPHALLPLLPLSPPLPYQFHIQLQVSDLLGQLLCIIILLTNDRSPVPSSIHLSFVNLLLHGGEERMLPLQPPSLTQKPHRRIPEILSLAPYCEPLLQKR